MNLTRRGFFAGGAAFAAVQVLGAGAANLRVGILSDVHVDGPRPAENLERALRYFDLRKVDAVLIAGDLTVFSSLREFTLMAETWFKVFPDDRRSDGVRIERLFVTGNHDVNKPDVAAQWQKFFKEEFRVVFAKTVKGYTFVLRNWLKPGEANPTADFLATLDLPQNRPFFYVQHEMPNDTVNASWLVKGERWDNGHDDGTSTKFLSAYPNVIAFSGHSHNSLTDEMSIWQGAFTAVNCSCNCGFVFMAPGRENGWSCNDIRREPPFEMPKIDIYKVNQGLVMEVFDEAVVLERHDFRNGRRLGPDWVIPTGPGAPKPYAIDARVRTAPKPSFPKDAKVKVWFGEGYGRDAGGQHRAKEKHDQVFVSFPPIRTADGSPARGWDFAVRAELVAGNVVRTLCERCVYDEGAFYAEEDDTQPVVCAFNRKDLPSKLVRRQKVRFVVTPRTCWSVEGEPIASPWTALQDIPGEIDETEDVQRRLDDCFRAGGGTVTLEKGVYRVGGLRVRSNTTLHLKAGAVLLGTRSVAAYDIMGSDGFEPLDAEDVPREDSTWIPARLRKGKRNMAFARAGSRWNNAIIRIYKATNVKIVAEKGAVIDGQNSYDPQGEEHYRGVHGISAHKSRNLEFRGYTIRHTGNWAHNVKDCRDVVFSDLEILAGHDGVHISSCDNVRIEDCTMKTGDDCVAGFDNRDVRVNGCTLNTACSAFRFGGTRFLAEKCRCYGPAEYLFRGSLSKAEKAEGRMASQTGRRNMLALFTYYADKSLDIREQPKEMTFRDITVEDADRFIHYNFSGNETWQLGMPLGSVRFENVTATGLKLPLCAYGEAARPVSLVFDRVSVRFARTVPEFIRGAWIRELTAKDLTVEGVEGPFFRNWSAMEPKLRFEGTGPSDQTVQAAAGEFKVRPI